MNKYLHSFPGVSLSILFFPLIAFASLSDSAFADDKVIKKKAATNEEVFTYKVIGGLTICNALNLGGDFKKAQEIAVRTYINVLVAKHDKKITNAQFEEETLSENNLIYGSQFMLISDATNRCPKDIPSEVKKAVEIQYKKLDKEIKKNNKNNKKKNNNKR